MPRTLNLNAVHKTPVCMYIHKYNVIKVKIKCSRYRPGVAQMVGRGIALLFHDRGTKRG